MILVAVPRAQHLQQVPLDFSYALGGGRGALTQRVGEVERNLLKVLSARDSDEDHRRPLFFVVLRRFAGVLRPSVRNLAKTGRF